MKSYLDQINEALQKHGHCFLPGLGLLHVIHKPASQNFQENKLYPPSQQIVLGTQQKNDEKFFSIEQQLMFSHQLSAEEAKKEWEKIRDQIKEKLSTGSSIALSNLGYLNLDEERRIQFIQDKDPLTFYDPVPIDLPEKRAEGARSEPAAAAGSEASIPPPEPQPFPDNLDAFQKPEAEKKSRMGPSWWIAGSIIALLIVAWFIYKGTMQRKGKKIALEQHIDSAATPATTPVIDSLKQVSDSIDLAHDSISYLIVIAIFHNKNKAKHQYEKMRGWGHPVVLKNKDSNTYEMAMPFTSLPGDTTANLEQMKITYGSHAYIEYDTTVK